jgi:ATPases with chaperone activity, ATP-binding subunit
MNLNSLSQTLMENQAIELIFDDQVVKKIAQIGYDPTFGARPLKRAIDDHIKSVLSEKILSGQFVRGHKILVGYRARIRNHGHSCFLCEIVIRSQFPHNIRAGA